MKIFNRNERIKIITEEKQEVQFQLNLKVTEEEENFTIIRRERDPSNRNRKVWPLVAMKVIIEMLVNGIAPSAVVKNLESTLRLISPNAVA